MKQFDGVVGLSLLIVAVCSVLMGVLSGFVGGLAHDCLFGISLSAAFYVGESVTFRVLHCRTFANKSGVGVLREAFFVNDGQSLI